MSNTNGTYGNIVERISDTAYGGEVYLTHFADGVGGITQTTDMSGNILIRSYSNSTGQWNEIHRGPASYTDPVHLQLGAMTRILVFAQYDNVEKIRVYGRPPPGLLDRESKKRKDYWRMHTISLEQINQFTESNTKCSSFSSRSSASLHS